jgi:hypothetical protein
MITRPTSIAQRLPETPLPRISSYVGLLFLDLCAAYSIVHKDRSKSILFSNLARRKSYTDKDLLLSSQFFILLFQHAHVDHIIPFPVGEQGMAPSAFNLESQPLVQVGSSVIEGWRANLDFVNIAISKRPVHNPVDSLPSVALSLVLLLNLNSDHSDPLVHQILRNSSQDNAADGRRTRQVRDKLLPRGQ